MRGLAIGITLATILVLVPGGRYLLVAVVPLAFFALVRYRTTWQPVSRTSDVAAPDRRGTSAG